MPLYEFSCTNCPNTQDEVYKIADCPTKIKCSKCGKWAVKVISIGAIQCDSMNDVPWLESAVMNLQPDGERPVQTRGEYKRYLKERGIIASG